ncbi:hypothetical protein [Staphylococcus argenteus]|uniref:hypothetical protein n=1 Tax=Staphylococcus argenteus TaxID=985002 RepID=UPI0005054562|nr:hypothetical protein [Staphylococcus argenteus]API79207.1 hypothetical protein A7971_05760 [Staphylococcus argenteus]MBE2122510.1 hypothetical protein [Staphylococcus argenteus]MBE2141103.1 hypothetical protein [Staphylococcus argenteus]MCG6475631.1 hypothetical protein [Staphylococcus argenteus]MCG9805990.1 hypothetical protein [Staphylococcus argenteus]
MNDNTSNDLYGKIKHCNEFINDSNHSNQIDDHETENTSSEHIKNTSEINQDDDLFKHVKNILRKQGQI